MAFPPPAPWHFPLWRQDSNTNWVLLLKLQLVRCFLAGFLSRSAPSQVQAKALLCPAAGFRAEGVRFGKQQPPCNGFSWGCQAGAQIPSVLDQMLSRKQIWESIRAVKLIQLWLEHLPWQGLAGLPAPLRVPAVLLPDGYPVSPAASRVARKLWV